MRMELMFQVAMTIKFAPLNEYCMYFTGIIHENLRDMNLKLQACWDTDLHRQGFFRHSLHVRNDEREALALRAAEALLTDLTLVSSVNIRAGLCPEMPFLLFHE